MVQEPEIVGGFRGDIDEELHLNPAGGDGPDGDVEEYDRIFGVGRPQVPLHASVCSGGGHPPPAADLSNQARSCICSFPPRRL